MEMGYVAPSNGDTTATGLSYSTATSGDTVKYTFASSTHDQESEIICLDYDGGPLVNGDTLICTDVYLELENVTYTLQCPVNAIVSGEGNNLWINVQWCILPLNGLNVNCYILLLEN